VDNHYSKSGTPTFGGVGFILALIISVLAFCLGKNSSMALMCLVVTVAYCLVGFLDDFIKVRFKHNLGLKAYQKVIGQVGIAVLMGVFVYLNGFVGSGVLVPFTNSELNLGWAIIPFVVFVFLATTNAVNLTDGLDGLAGGLSAIAFLAFALIAWGSVGITGSSDIGVFCFILVGALFAFLFYNTHPAKVFMGDTGSLSLGGTLAAVAIVTDHELTLIIVAGVFVIETLATIIQLISVRLTGKRVFLMTPIHYHFVKLGWKETDVVKMFWFVGIVLASIAILWGVWI
jgi:phospho-N-acetylmuramoyl-pentapeptide-transferase